MAIDIPSLFSDIIETDQQRQTRLLTEGALLGRELTGNLRTGSGASLGQRLVATAAPTITAIAGQLPQRREDTRRALGGMLGLDVRTQGEKVQEILSKGNASTPEGLRDLAVALQNVAPAQATQLRQEAAAQAAAQSAAAATQRLTRLQIENQLAEAKNRRAVESARIEREALENTQNESVRTGLKSAVRRELMKYGPSDLLESYEQRIDGGQFDSAADAARLFEELNPEEKLIPYGNNLYNADTGEFVIPPQTDPQTGVILDPSLKDHDPSSISRYFQKVRN